MPTRFPLFLALALSAPYSFSAQEEPSADVDAEDISNEEQPADEEQPAEVTVSAKRRPPKASFDRIRSYESEDLERSSAFTVSEVLKELPPGPSGTAPTILINGRATTLDLNSLPAGIIDRLEVNLDGGMPNGRPRVAGQVINVILKTDYHGGDVNLRQRNAFAGGGGQGEVTANAGYMRGDFNVTLMATHQSQHALAASQREISREQDHTAFQGRDFRLPWGSPPVVQAITGNLNGVLDDGRPSAVALAPDPIADDSPAASDFIAGPAGTTSAEGLRHFNTADFLHLVAPSETTSAGVTLGYPLTERVRLDFGYNFSGSRNEQISPPPVTAPSSGAIVPAAFNPFGQDVAVGFVHLGFGAQRQESSAVNHAAYLSADGKVGEAWTWNAHFNLNRSDFESSSRELNAEKFAAALAAADPAQRFDPFATSTAGSQNAALYPSLTRTRQTDGQAESTSFGITTGGKISEGWVGPLLLNVDLSQDINENRQDDRADLAEAMVTSNNELSSLRGNGSLQVPVFKLREASPPAILSLSTNWSDDDQDVGMGTPKTSITTTARDGSLQIPWLTPLDEWRGAYRLETELGLGRAARSGEKDSQTQNAGIAWAPLKPLMVRARYSRNQVPPPNMLFPAAVVYNQTFSDPRRNVATATDVQLVTGAPIGLEPALNDSQFFSVDFEPPAITGLSLGLNYNVQSQLNPLRSFSGQDVIDNEGVLPDRVTRAPRTPEDIAAGQPGAIVEVDVTPFTAGASRNRSLGLSAQFSRQETRIGAVHVNASATRLLKSTNELLPGVPVISSSDQDSPPEWMFRGNAFLSHRLWRAGLDVAHTGTGRYANAAYSSFTTVDVRLAYQFDEPLWGRIGKRLQLGCGIQNLLDADPPRVDTVTGFRGDSAIGRTYELTLRAPLGG